MARGVEELGGVQRSRLPMRALLEFRDPDGQIRAEVLGRNEEFAELVDPTDGSVRHGGPFVMHGREWQIENVRVTDRLIRIMCVSTSQVAAEAGHTVLYRV